MLHLSYGRALLKNNTKCGYNELQSGPYLRGLGTGSDTIKAPFITVVILSYTMYLYQSKLNNYILYRLIV